MVERLNNSTGVLDVLKHLQLQTRDLGSAEQRVSSGLRVDAARDDVNAFHSAAIMRQQNTSLNAVTLSLARAESISETAINVAEKAADLLVQMQETVIAGTGEDLTQDQRDAWMARFADQKRQLEAFIRTASFDEANILDGSKPAGVSFIADSEAAVTLSLKGRNFLAGGNVIMLDDDHDLSSPANAFETKAALDASITNVGHQLTEMAAERKRIEAQKGFVSKLADALASGVSRMVDTDLAAESALIQALQVKQQLSAQSVGIANGAPHVLLALFRN